MFVKRIDISDYHLAVPLFDAYRVFYKQPSDIELAEQFIRERILNNESVIFIAQVNHDGGLFTVGFTQLYPLISSVRAIKNWLLNDLYVDPAFRKQGIGEALINAAAGFATKGGAKYLKLETAADNLTAQSLYEGIGFKKQQVSEAFYIYQKELV